MFTEEEERLSARIEELEQQAAVAAKHNRAVVEEGVRLLKLPDIGPNGTYCAGILIEGIEKLQARVEKLEGDAAKGCGRTGFRQGEQ